MEAGIATIPPGSAVRQDWAEKSFVPRHLHVTPYAAVVIAGRYEECGWFGRWCAGPGTVLIHGRFDMHLDHFQQRAQILNLRLDDGVKEPAIGRIDDVDAVARLAQRDPVAAEKLLNKQMKTATQMTETDWPEMLADNLKADRPLDIRAWAHRIGIAPETATRGFFRVFGITPARFRSQWRCRRALLAMNCGAPLSAIAAATGFADQAHMTRQVRALTGRTPGAWCRIGRN